jgi:hypothetical protein
MRPPAAQPAPPADDADPPEGGGDASGEPTEPMPEAACEDGAPSAERCRRRRRPFVL